MVLKEQFFYVFLHAVLDALDQLHYLSPLGGNHALDVEGLRILRLRHVERIRFKKYAAKNG